MSMRPDPTYLAERRNSTARYLPLPFRSSHAADGHGIALPLTATPFERNVAVTPPRPPPPAP